MGKYIKVFDKTTDYEAFKVGEDWLTPNLCVIKENNCVNFQKYIKPKNNYLTMLALEDGFQAKFSGNTVEYKIDSGEWTTLAPDTYTPTVNAGQTLSFRGNLTPSVSNGGLGDIGSYGIGTFTISKKCNVSGNVMSMLFGDNGKDSLSLTGKNYSFYKLFYNCDNIISAKDLYLPATTLADFCYSEMFYGCTSLTTAPELPSTTLSDYCYDNMFHDCTSLVTAPELPATTLNESCYSNMFNGCTSLETAPELHATTLTSSCYNNMFSGCISLVTAPELPATTLANACYASMFSGCKALVTAPELPATTLANYCYQYMFNGCSKLVTAPELPATTLANYCYYSMFYGCSKLNNITMLATNISASGCLSNWVNSVSSSGTLTKAASMTSLPSGVDGIPSGWTVQDYNS